MSEQEMNLDTAIQLFQLVTNYEEYAERLLQVLQRVHTHEELDRAREVIDEKKQELTENKTEFNAIMERRKQEAKQRADYSKAIHRAKMAEVTVDANRIRSEAMLKAESARRDADRMRSGVDDWVARTKFKTVDPEELEKKLDDKLGCPNPKCEDYGKNRRNIINDVPACIRCWHKLVPKSKFKDYYRKYWRKYNKKRKKRKK